MVFVAERDAVYKLVFRKGGGISSPVKAACDVGYK